LGVLKNQRHEKFAQLVMLGKNYVEAFLGAGYAKPKNDNTLRGMASKLGSKSIIKDRVTELQKKAENKAVFTKTDVLRSIKRGMDYDIRDLFDENGVSLKPKDLSDTIAKTIVGVDISEIYQGQGESRKKIGEIKKFRFESRAKNTEMGGRHLKLFTDVIEHTVSEDLANRLGAARARSKKR